METNNISTGAMREDITRMIEKMRDLAGQQDNANKINTKSSGFSELLNQAQAVVKNVNELQSSSTNLKSLYVSGNTSVSLSQVVIASQKSELAFQALLTVRNKLVESYKEVMNMPL